MTDLSRAAAPSTDAFPYYLEVNDNHDPDAGICHYPREGYARLSYWNRETGYTNIAEYIQEQSFADSVVMESDIHAPVLVHDVKNAGERPGWDSGPGALWDFIETVRDEYYENGVDPSSLPVRVVTNTHTVGEPDETDYPASCEIYFRNGANDVEYIMWNSNELYGPADNSVGYVADSELIQKVLAAFARAYEEPTEFLEQWRSHKVPI